MVILRLQKQSVFKQKTLCFSNPGFDKKIQVLGAVQVLESQVFPPSPQLAHEYATLFQNYPSYALTVHITLVITVAVGSPHYYQDEPAR